jgi:chaperonin GroES
MAVNLLLHHILVKPEDVSDVDEVYRRAKAAGIKLELDKREQKAVEYGTVVAVGPTAFKDYHRGPDILKVGDKLTFAKYAGKSIKDGDNEYLILNDEDCLAVITEE